VRWVFLRCFVQVVVVPGLTLMIVGQSIGPASASTENITDLASFTYDLVNMSVLTLDADGRPGMSVWSNGKTWSAMKAPDLTPTAPRAAAPENPKFSAIAGNSQRLVYGIVDGAIHQWTFLSLSPWEWVYMGEVTVGG